MKIGLALGSGAARGWAHIGIIDVLAEHGIVPDIVAGTSIGAIVGASYACGQIDRLRESVLSINKLKWATFFSPSTSIDGWINRNKMREFLAENGIVEGLQMSDTKIPFGCVACDYETGHEKWLTSGSLLESVWASMAMPGLFPPVQRDGHWLIDGGIINPVPVSLCRAMGADLVIAVNLNNDILHRPPVQEEKPRSDSVIMNRVKDKARQILPQKIIDAVSDARDPSDIPEPPSAIENMARSVNIVQDIITRSRLAGNPPDVLLTPNLAHFGILETYRGEEGIANGRQCCLRMIPAIEQLIGERRRAGY